MNNMKRKANNLPTVNYIHQPEKVKKKSADETAAEVLTFIRQHEPEEQNQIVAALLKEMAIDRWGSVKSNRDAAMRAEKNADVFFSLSHSIQEAAKEATSK